MSGRLRVSRDRSPAQEVHNDRNKRQHEQNVNDPGSDVKRDEP